jgi:hypothetical protein
MVARSILVDAAAGSHPTKELKSAQRRDSEPAGALGVVQVPIDDNVDADLRQRAST